MLELPPGIDTLLPGKTSLALLARLGTLRTEYNAGYYRGAIKTGQFTREYHRRYFICMEVRFVPADAPAWDTFGFTLLQRLYVSPSDVPDSDSLESNEAVQKFLNDNWNARETIRLNILMAMPGFEGEGPIVEAGEVDSKDIPFPGLPNEQANRDAEKQYNDGFLKTKLDELSQKLVLRLRAMQGDCYLDIATETQRNGSDVWKQASSLRTCRALLAGYVYLSMPSMYAGDDYLRGLVTGADGVPDGGIIAKSLADEVGRMRGPEQILGPPQSPDASPILQMDFQAVTAFINDFSLKRVTAFEDYVTKHITTPYRDALPMVDRTMSQLNMFSLTQGFGALPQ